MNAAWHTATARTPPGRRLVQVLAILAVAGLAVWASWQGAPLPASIPIPERPPAPSSDRSLPEVSELARSPLSATELKSYFQMLARQKGAPYAYDVLRSALLPPDTDLHLLGHYIGDVLYQQQGAAGMRVCTREFRNACSHSIVVAMFGERGEAALPEIAEACRGAPGGSGAYTMCFHGLGHGVLASVGYNLPEAVRLCAKTGTRGREYREYHECGGGAIMEIISGGDHSKALWASERQTYLAAGEPLSPCSRNFVPAKVKPICYLYLTPWLWEAVGADLGRPAPQDHERAMRLCQGIRASETASRETCYGGFGKEFIVLVPGRDIRRIEELTDRELNLVHEWCNLAPDRVASAACVVYAMYSLYWGGENDRAVAIRFCGLAPDGFLKDACVKNLIRVVSIYIQDADYRRGFCQELDASYRQACRGELGT